jgi:RNA polymerase primary sigma factor
MYMTNEEIVKLIQSGVNPRGNMQLLYEQNMGFIHSTVKRYRFVCHVENPYTETSVIEYPELLQEAFIGLCNAVKGYDASMEYKFLTYAEHWIRQAVKRYLDNCGNTIRVPVWLKERIYHYNRIQSHFMNKYGRQATTVEIADIMSASIKTVENLEMYIFRSGEPMSLDAPLTADDDSDLTIADSIADKSVNIEDQVVDELVNEEVSEVWTEVARVLRSPIMKDIIIYRYRDDMTLKEIADKIGMTSESVRHYESKGLRRLRSDSRTKRMFAMIA